MDDKTEIKDRIELEAEKFKEKQHNVTMKGYADETGMIASNGANPDVQQPLSKKENNKRNFETQLELAQQWLDDFLQALDNQIAAIEKRMSAIEQIKDLYKRGERDFNSSDQMQILSAAGLSKEDVLALGEDGLDQYWNELKIQRDQWEQIRQEASKVDRNSLDDINGFKGSVHTGDLHKSAQVILNKVLSDMDDPNEVMSVQKTRGFSDSDLKIQEEVSNLKTSGNLDSFFDEPDELTTTSIETQVNLGAAFSQAASLEQFEAELELKEQPVFTSSAPKMWS